MKYVEFKDFVGKTFRSVTVNDDKTEILFVTDDGRTFRMFHFRDCCEWVEVEDINGELDWLVGSPVLTAEESESQKPPAGAEKKDDSDTWTFYRISTEKGMVVIRWHGSSNGYYSESVDIVEVSK